MKRQILFTIMALVFSATVNSQNLVKFKAENGKWGMKDKTGKEVVSPAYDYISDYENGVYRIFEGDTFDYGGAKSGVFGLVDDKGNIIVKPVYNFIYAFKKDKSEAAGEFEYARVFKGETWEGCNPKNGKYGFIDRSGKEVIPLEYERADDFHNGLARVTKNGKSGYIDRSQNEVIPLKYDHIRYIRYHRAVTFMGEIDDMGNDVEGKYGLVDDKGNEILPPVYDVVRAGKSDYIIAKKDDMWGIVKIDGTVVLPFDYDMLIPSRDGNYVVFQGDPGDEETPPEGKFGLVDKKGNFIINMDYQYLYPIGKGIYIAKKDRKAGIIDIEQNEILPFKYDNILPVDEAGGFMLPRIVKDGKYGVIDNNGKVILKPEYDRVDMTFLNMGYILVFKNIDPDAGEYSESKAGCANTDGKLILPVKYDSIIIINENKIMVMDGDKELYFDKEGKEIDN
jgi:hypothetical protein